MSAYFDSFAEWAHRSPKAPALSHSLDPQGGATYGQLLELARGYAVTISRFAPVGAIVPIYANKSVASIALMLGCLSAGRPFAWVNKRLRGPQLTEIATDASIEVMVCDAMGLVGLGSSIASSPILSATHWQVLIRDDAPPSESRALKRTIHGLPEGVRVSHLEPTVDQTRPSLDGTAADAVGCCLFTSGSTGRQKGVAVAEADLHARAKTEARWYGLENRDRLLSVLPLGFDVGLNQTLSGFLAGACVVVQDSWLPKDLLRTVTERTVTGISGVPSVWRDLLDSGLCLDPGGAHRALRYITVSGGSLSQSEQQRLVEASHGLDIFKTYGQTETFRSASLQPHELTEKPTSVGRAYPGTCVLVLDEAGKPCAPCEVGEIVHLGDGTMVGYVGGRHSEKIRALPSTLGGGRAVFTGDHGSFYEDGHLFLGSILDSQRDLSRFRRAM